MIYLVEDDGNIRKLVEYALRKEGFAEELIVETHPDYEPWFSPLFEPASGEIESLLFALQAALGAGVIGFVLGRMTAKKPEGKA